ncbi:MAG: DUF169 domain-containing protein [Nitrospirota bacterium]
MQQSSEVVNALGLTKPPIAIGFLESQPEGLPLWNGGAVPAGCTFWQKAMSGERFCTVPSDHYGCAVGSYTHKIALPEVRAHELNDTIGFMVESRYVAMSEVPGIPTLAQAPNIIAYGPADQPGFTPNLILIAAKPSQAMLIYEAAIKAGASSGLMNLLGRPACAVLPLTMMTHQASISLGCKGNRTFTGLPDEELYLTIPAERWEPLLESLTETLNANQVLGQHYAGKLV